MRIERVYLPTETLGSWYGNNNQVLVKTMELPWRFNQRSVSCIPEGEHLCIKELWTKKHPYPHFRLPYVKGRTGILVHKITFVKDLLGCIGVGLRFFDFNKDQVPDIADSTAGLKLLYEYCPDQFLLKIMRKP